MRRGGDFKDLSDFSEVGDLSDFSEGLPDPIFGFADHNYYHTDDVVVFVS